MNWSTEYPTKPGFYWIRNYTAKGAENYPPTPGPDVIEMRSSLFFYFPGNENIWEQSDIVSAEWQGPIEPESEVKDFPALACRECQATSRSFVSWNLGEVDGRIVYGIICRECWIKRLTPEQRKVYMV